jgi:basic membrane protein A
MKRKLSAVLVLIAVFGLGMAGCASSAEKLKVAMVLPGLKTDEAFNPYTYEGMLRAKEELGIDTAVREEVAQDEQLEVIRQFAQLGYDIIIGQGGNLVRLCRPLPKNFLTSTLFSAWLPKLAAFRT